MCGGRYPRRRLGIGDQISSERIRRPGRCGQSLSGVRDSSALRRPTAGGPDGRTCECDRSGLGRQPIGGDSPGLDRLVLLLLSVGPRRGAILPEVRYWRGFGAIRASRDWGCGDASFGFHSRCPSVLPAHRPIANRPCVRRATKALASTRWDGALNPSPAPPSLPPKKLHSTTSWAFRACAKTVRACHSIENASGDQFSPAHATTSQSASLATWDSARTSSW